MCWRTFVTPVAVMGLLLASCGSDDDSTTVDDTMAPVERAADTATTSTRSTAPDEPPGTLDLADEDDDGDDGDDGDDDGTDDAGATTVPQPATTVDDTPSTTAETDPAADTPERDDLPGLLDLGDVAVTIDVPEGGVSGELFEISITNTSDDNRSFIVPCGLLFTPDGGDEQRMMNLRPFQIDLATGESATIAPYVMCIDGSSPAPDAGAAYLVGTFAGDDLAALAECICDSDVVDEIDPLDEMSLQMAVWAVADGSFPDLDGALEQTDSALGDLVGNETGVDFGEIAELLEAQDIPGMEGIDIGALLAQASTFLDSYLADAAAWIDRCEIELAD